MPLLILSTFLPITSNSRSMLFYFIQVAEGAKAAGASRIIGVDIDPKKASLGKPDYTFPL